MAADYNELLRHPFWQRKRLEIFQRDNFTCQRCTDTISNLQVHHLYYLPNKMPWEYPGEALITLCDLCHTKAEFYKWMQKKGQAQLIRLGLNYYERQEMMSLISNKVRANLYRADALKYIDDIKILLT